MKTTHHEPPQSEAAPNREPCSPAEAREIIAAASAALPVVEVGAQAFGSRTAWGAQTRPGRIKARSRAIRLLIRAAGRAMECRPQLETRHVVAALRSLVLTPQDLLVDALSGAWLSTREAVAHRGEEISRAISELAMVVLQLETEVLQ